MYSVHGLSCHVLRLAHCIAISQKAQDLFFLGDFAEKCVNNSVDSCNISEQTLCDETGHSGDRLTLDTFATELDC